MAISRWVSMGFEALYAFRNTGTVGANNAILWKAKEAGPAGVLISVELLDPGDINKPLTVTVTNKKISVSLATDGVGTITSTATLVIAAIVGNTDANALVAVRDFSTSDGTGVVVAEALAVLVGFGTAVAGKYFIDPTRVSLDVPSDPFVRYEGASGRGNRAIVPAAYVPEGDIETVVDKWHIGGLLRGFIPEANYQAHGVTKSGSVTDTTNQDEAAGVRLLHLVDATGFSVDDIVQIGADWALSELHKVTAVDGVGNILTIEDELTRTHLSGVTVVKITPAGYVHVFDIGGDDPVLTSMTFRVAKDFDEQVFQGGLVSQLQVSAEHNGLASLTASIVAQQDTVASVTALPSVGALATAPYAGVHITTAVLIDPYDDPAGNKDISAYIRSAEFTVSNNVEGEDGIRMGSRFPIELQGNGLDVTARLTLVFRNRDQYDDFWGGSSPQESATQRRTIRLVYSQGADHYFEVQMFQAYLTAPATEVSGRDMLVQTLEYGSIQEAPTDVVATFRLRNTSEHRYF